MVSGIGNVNFNSSYVTSPVDDAQRKTVQNLLRYTNNEIDMESLDTFGNCVKGNITSLGLFDSIRGFNWLRTAMKAGKVSGAGITGFLAMYDCRANAVRTALKGFTEGGIFKNFGKKLGNFFNATEIFSANSAAITKAMQQTAKSKAISGIIDTTADVAQVTVASSKGVLGKLGGVLKKGGAIFSAVLEGAIELGTEVAPTFRELGLKAGFKQVGKSLTKVAGSVLGYCAGEYVGTAIGAAIGSFFPGVGTAIGAAIGGTLGGSITSWFGTKLASKITGKSERSISAQKQLDTNTNAVLREKSAMDALKLTVLAKVSQEYQAFGTLSKESQQAFDELMKLDPSIAYALQAQAQPQSQYNPFMAAA